ncbi:MAG: hypothetical protein FJ146_01930 [Deltaproteobacteria bacterium]|nr:hypothetical protein [Deltaproteobacteria bacterium]
MLRTIYLAILTCVWCVGSACKQKSGFSAQGDSSLRPAAGGSPTDPCGPAGTTKAELLTPTLANGSPGNYLEYEIALVDCEGKARPLTANRILFDVDARFSGPRVNAPLSYSVSLGSETVSGELTNIQGSDLFGRSGANLFHYATENKIDFGTKFNSLRLRIDLAGHQLKSTTGGTAGPNDVATYLRFGDARAVEQLVRLQ